VNRKPVYNPVNMPTSKNPERLRERRRRKRRELEKKGWPKAEIDNYIERMHFEQDCGRFGVEVARQMRYDRVKTPDDKGYKPPKRDSLLHGVGRATGDTAKAVKSRKAIVK